MYLTMIIVCNTKRKTISDGNVAMQATAYARDYSAMIAENCRSFGKQALSAISTERVHATFTTMLAHENKWLM